MDRVGMMRVLTGYMPARALGVAAELRIPDALCAGPLTLEELAERTGTQPAALARLLRAIAGLGVVESDGDRWALGPAGDLLLDGPGTLYGLAVSHTTEMLRAWVDLDRAIRSGDPSFDDAYGMPYFTYLATRPERSDQFNAAMAAIMEHAIAPLLALDWSATDSVIDVGGGTGALLAGLLARQPHLRGTVFDQPHVTERTCAALAGSPLADRLDAAGGDMFDEIPSGADTYVLAQVLHDWEDEDALRILAAIRRVIPPGGRLVLLELVLADDGRDHLANWVDLHMLAVIGGRERTEPAWRALLSTAGFFLAAVHTGPRSCALVALPA
ncbi:MAG: O-methyltransferase [Actinomycetia bacterium]|nr:O-methyltransferase [Actinomycetes bacterium]